jgi:EAL domain-containing protein (putative c-di-GMP-specific phosphodiesterase class I)/pSer/pThr/pTyr-binding forkhead associated (FHA) protein
MAKDASSSAREAERARAALWLAHPQRAGAGPDDTVAGSTPAAGTPAPQPSRWVLESVGNSGRQLRRVPLEPLPFRIGRQPGLELVLPSHLVSKLHAQVFEVGGELRIRDLESRNGTYVNRRAVKESVVNEGDILHLGDFEFRIGRQPVEAEGVEDSASTASFTAESLSRFFVEGTRELKELLERAAVTVELQPIVRFPGAAVAAFEALGRGTHPALARSPIELFRVAECMGAEAELSRLFRRRAVELARERSNVASLFLNTHPSELAKPGLVESLEELRALAPHLDLTLEIHESALAQPAFMASLRDQLSEINVGLAYDDFGAGQARLLELAEAPPHYLKFDRKFVSGIDQASAQRRRLLASLLAAARELLVKTVAEGVETPGEAEVCARLGFTHAQGYHFGYPRPVEEM